MPTKTYLTTLPLELQSQILAHLPNDHTHTTSISSASTTSRFSKPLLDAARVSRTWCLLCFDILWTRGYGCIYGRDKDLARERFIWSCSQWNLARSIGAQWAVAVRRYASGNGLGESEGLGVTRCHVCGAEQTVIGEENLVDVLDSM